MPACAVHCYVWVALGGVGERGGGGRDLGAGELEGEGEGVGSAAALEAQGAAGRVVWVCHELTPHARRALLEGAASAVINQDAAHEVRSACRVALAHLTRERLLVDQERIRIEIYLKDNLP